ncbi:hypothetical protein ACIQZO_26275 [Streptomyces sp. NPDC097617]|uniref:hypothetical protein n=1 Tax=Streptomyces sp. NPDC097617 TaxID=3366091 RepID=UPI003819BC18
MPSSPDEPDGPEPVHITVSDIEPVDGGPDGAVSVSVTVTDPNAPGRAAVFEYIAVPGYRLSPIAITVRPAPGLPYAEYISVKPSDMRDLPLSRWESAAQFQAEIQLGRGGPGGPYPVGDQTGGAEELVLKHFPELANDTTPAGLRKMRSMTHLASVAIEYATHSIFGVKDPAGAIARAREANPATVRSWIHRARKAGFLPETQREGGQQ